MKKRSKMPQYMKYGRVHRSLLSHLKYMTFKDLRNSRGDVSHIVVGYQVEPRIERLNTLLDLFVRKLKIKKMKK